MGLQSDCIHVLALEKLVGLMVQVHILPITKAIFVKHLWKFSVSSQIFNKVHLRVLHSLGILTFFTCINDVSASHRGVDKKPALTTAISAPVGQIIYWMLKKFCLSCVRE